MIDEDEATWPIKEGQRILTPSGEYGTVFWSYRDGDNWRVHYQLDDGRNENALHTELILDDYAPPPPGPNTEADICNRCGSRTVEFEIPALLCGPCWKEWFWADFPN